MCRRVRKCLRIGVRVHVCVRAFRVHKCPLTLVCTYMYRYVCVPTYVSVCVKFKALGSRFKSQRRGRWARRDREGEEVGRGRLRTSVKW